jgi:hypothetical protein
VPVKDRTHHLRNYPKCFLGHDFVECLLDNGLAIDDEAAISIGNQLMKLRVFRHVKNEYDFKNDANIFYRFAIHDRENAAPATPTPTPPTVPIVAAANAVSSPSSLSSGTSTNASTTSATPPPPSSPPPTSTVEAAAADKIAAASSPTSSSSSTIGNEPNVAVKKASIERKKTDSEEKDEKKRAASSGSKKKAKRVRDNNILTYAYKGREDEEAPQFAWSNKMKGRLTLHSSKKGKLFDMVCI